MSVPESDVGDSNGVTDDGDADDIATSSSTSDSDAASGASGDVKDDRASDGDGDADAPTHRWRVGDVVEVHDRQQRGATQAAWCRAKILKMRGTSLFIHFCGWSDRWDTWAGIDEIRALGTMTNDTTAPKDRSKFRLTDRRFSRKLDSMNRGLRALIDIYERYTEKAKRSWNSLGLFLCDDWSVQRIYVLVGKLCRNTSLMLDSMFEEADERARVLECFRNSLSLTAYVLQTRDVPVISTGDPLPSEVVQSLLNLTAALFAGADCKKEAIFYRKHGHCLEDYTAPKSSYFSHVRDRSGTPSPFSVHAHELVNHFGLHGGFDGLLAAVKSCTVHDASIVRAASVLETVVRLRLLDKKHTESISSVFRARLKAWSPAPASGATTNDVQVFCSAFKIANCDDAKPLIGVTEFWSLCLRCRVKDHSDLVNLLQVIHFNAGLAGRRAFRDMWRHFYARCIAKARQCSRDDRIDGDRVRAYRQYREKYLGKSGPSDLGPDDQSDMAEPSLASISPLSSTNDMLAYSSSLRNRFTSNINIPDSSCAVPELSRLWDMLELFFHFSGEAMGSYYDDLFDSVIICGERCINAAYVSKIWFILTTFLPSKAYLDAFNWACAEADGAAADVSHSQSHQDESTPRVSPPSSNVPSHQHSFPPHSTATSRPPFHFDRFLEEKACLSDHTGLYSESSVSSGCVSCSSGFSSPSARDRDANRRSSLSSLDAASASGSEMADPLCASRASSGAGADSQDLERNTSRADSSGADSSSSSPGGEQYSLGHTESAARAAASSAASSRQQAPAASSSSSLQQAPAASSSASLQQAPASSSAASSLQQAPAASSSSSLPQARAASSAASSLQQARTSSSSSLPQARAASSAASSLQEARAAASAASSLQQARASSASSLQQARAGNTQSDSNPLLHAEAHTGYAQNDSNPLPDTESSNSPSSRRTLTSKESSAHNTSTTHNSNSSPSNNPHSSPQQPEETFASPSSSSSSPSASSSAPCHNHQHRSSLSTSSLSCSSFSSSSSRSASSLSFIEKSCGGGAKLSHNKGVAAGASQSQHAHHPHAHSNGSVGESKENSDCCGGTLANVSASLSLSSQLSNSQAISSVPLTSRFFTLIPDDLTNLIVQFVCAPEDGVAHPFAPTVPLNTRLSAGDGVDWEMFSEVNLDR